MNIKVTKCPDGFFKAVCGDKHCFALTKERAIALWHELYGGEQ